MTSKALVIGLAIAGIAAGQLASVAEQGSSKKGNPSSVQLYGRADIVSSSCAAAGISLSSTVLPAQVQKVRLGSPAYYAGLSEHDRILSAEIANNKLDLSFVRNGQTYSIRLNTAPAKLFPDKLKAEPSLGGRANQLTAAVPAAPEPPLKRLSRFDIVLVADCSGSMSWGTGTGDGTRWEWCQSHVCQLARDLRSVSQASALTLVTFNSSYRVYSNCTPEDIDNICANVNPVGGTNLAAPLQAVFNDYLSRHSNRPLLIVVMTDGCPNIGGTGAQPIIDATIATTRPDQIRLKLFMIGEDPAGVSLASYLDHCLVSDGAKYDIVDSLPFDRLQKMPFPEAILSQEEVTAHSNSAHSRALEEELATLKQRIKQLQSSPESEKMPEKK